MTTVTCAMATYGRRSKVEESLAQFLLQDCPDKHLLILNSHPIPMHFEHRQVVIVNEPEHRTLGHCRNRLLDLTESEIFVIYDDDDLRFPWFLSQGTDHLRSAAAWKPLRSWWFNGADGRFDLARNRMEASIFWRTDQVRRHRFYEGNGNESVALCDRLEVEMTDMGRWPGYCYVWGQGMWHASGTIGDGKPEAQRADEWKRMNNDARSGSLVPNFDAVESWYCRFARSLGERIIAASGCWDLLHDGHVYTLRWAKQQGDALVVLANDDDGVAVQKGIGRPVQTLADRIRQLQHLEFVDFVIVVRGKDDSSILKKLEPYAVVKGPDYRGCHVAARALF
jgi:cytidyltransferase-like protein